MQLDSQRLCTVYAGSSQSVCCICAFCPHLHGESATVAFGEMGSAVGSETRVRRNAESVENLLSQGANLFLNGHTRHCRAATVSDDV
jgi:hypothetical protein